MKEPVIIEWYYEPIDFFEEKIKFNRENYSYDIDNGKVTLRIDAEQFNNDQSIKENIDMEIEGCFLGAMSFNHRRFFLKNKSFVRHLSAGKRAITLVFDASASISTTSIDQIVIDKGGNIIRDSKTARLAAVKKISELSSEYYRKDKTANAILTSYKAAVDDPKNELVYLYEIRETLMTYFSNTNKVLKSLNVTKKDWSNFGRIANDAPLLEGRHRGKNFEELRPATQQELKEAREFSVKLITSYLEYIKNMNKYIQ